LLTLRLWVIKRWIWLYSRKPCIHLTCSWFSCFVCHRLLSVNTQPERLLHRYWLYSLVLLCYPVVKSVKTECRLVLYALSKSLSRTLCSLSVCDDWQC